MTLFISLNRKSRVLLYLGYRCLTQFYPDYPQTLGRRGRSLIGMMLSEYGVLSTGEAKENLFQNREDRFCFAFVTKKIASHVRLKLFFLKMSLQVRNLVMVCCCPVILYVKTFLL